MKFKKNYILESIATELVTKVISLDAKLKELRTEHANIFKVITSVDINDKLNAKSRNNSEKATDKIFIKVKKKKIWIRKQQSKLNAVWLKPNVHS